MECNVADYYSRYNTIIHYYRSESAKIGQIRSFFLRKIVIFLSRMHSQNFKLTQLRRKLLCNCLLLNTSLYIVSSLYFLRLRSKNILRGLPTLGKALTQPANRMAISRNFVMMCDLSDACPKTEINFPKILVHRLFKCHSNVICDKDFYLIILNCCINHILLRVTYTTLNWGRLKLDTVDSDEFSQAFFFSGWVIGTPVNFGGLAVIVKFNLWKSQKVLLLAKVFGCCWDTLHQ
jgi:hypothetical protein